MHEKCKMCIFALNLLHLATPGYNWLLGHELKLNFTNYSCSKASLTHPDTAYESCRGDRHHSSLPELLICCVCSKADNSSLHNSTTINSYKVNILQNPLYPLQAADGLQLMLWSFNKEAYE